MKKSYHKLVKELRTKLGFRKDQEGFANWLGESRAVIANIETGRTPPNASICLQLAAYASETEDREFLLELAGFSNETLTRLTNVMAQRQAAASNAINEEGTVRYLIHKKGPPPSLEEQELLAKALEVLRRRDENFRDALAANIQGWYRAIQIAGPEKPGKKEKISGE